MGKISLETSSLRSFGVNAVELDEFCYPSEN